MHNSPKNKVYKEIEILHFRILVAELNKKNCKNEVMIVNQKIACENNKNI